MSSTKPIVLFYKSNPVSMTPLLYSNRLLFDSTILLNVNKIAHA